MENDYIDYPYALNELNITDLYQRREKLSKNLALKITKNQKVKHMLPLRTEYREDTRRQTETYKTHRANTQRLKTSTILFMQHSSHKHSFPIGNLVQQHTPIGYNCPPSQLMRSSPKAELMKALHKLSQFLAVSGSCACRLALIRRVDSCSSGCG